MATSNAQETLARANDFIARYNTGSIVISEGATVLATHTITGMSASNSGNNAVINSTTIADVAIGNTYIRLDVSSVAGTFLDGYLGGDKKDFLQPFQLGVGYVTYNSPIEITTNSDLAIGASVFINSTLLSGPALGNGKEDFGTYGYSIIADYQLDDYLNVFAEYSRGKRNEGEAADRIREFRVRAAYNIYNGIYVTLSSNLKKYTDEGPDYKKEVGATTFSIGLLFK